MPSRGTGDVLRLVGHLPSVLGAPGQSQLHRLRTASKPQVIAPRGAERMTGEVKVMLCYVVSGRVHLLLEETFLKQEMRLQGHKSGLGAGQKDGGALPFL